MRPPYEIWLEISQWGVRLPGLLKPLGQVRAPGLETLSADFQTCLTVPRQALGQLIVYIFINVNKFMDERMSHLGGFEDLKEFIQ